MEEPRPCRYVNLRHAPAILLPRRWGWASARTCGFGRLYTADAPLCTAAALRNTQRTSLEDHFHACLNRDPDFPAHRSPNGDGSPALSPHATAFRSLWKHRAGKAGPRARNPIARSSHKLASLISVLPSARCEHPDPRNSVIYSQHRAACPVKRPSAAQPIAPWWRAAVAHIAADEHRAGGPELS